MFAFEPLHLMRMRKKGQNGQMALKLDMSKVYDKVESPSTFSYVEFFLFVLSLLIWFGINEMVLSLKVQ